MILASSSCLAGHGRGFQSNFRSRAGLLLSSHCKCSSHLIVRGARLVQSTSYVSFVLWTSVHRTPNPHAMSRSRTRDFSRVVFCVSCVGACQRLSHAQHVHVSQGPHGSSVVSSQKHLSSHSAQHGTQYTFSDDSAIIEHFTTSHLHSNPPFDQTINGTSADLLAATILYMCLSVPWPICTRLQVMSPKILQKRTILCRLNRYSSTDRV